MALVGRARRVVCTGVGMISPLGLNAKNSWSALLDSKSGIRKLKDEHSFVGNNSKVAAYVDNHNDKLGEILQDSKHSYLVQHSKQLSRATLFAMLATHEALEDAKLIDDRRTELDERLRANCGVAIGQGMVDFQDIYENGKLVSDETKSGFRKMSPYFMTRVLMNMSAGNVSIRYKSRGPNHCVSTACATGAHSIGDAMEFIRTGRADIMICGSTESCINSISVAGFERLRALCLKYNEKPHEASRPFDTNRAGFVMGEGAGIIILEELEHAKSRGLKNEHIYCEMLAYGLSSDAHHLTAPLPDGGGAKMCMESALTNAGIEASAISHINSHATSTPLGDDIECNAIEELFLNEVALDKRTSELSVTSCKGSLGHLLGGAGSVETIFAILSCQQAIQPHCLNLENPLQTQKGLINFVQHEPRVWAGENRVLMKNSFGFGGTNASLVISNYV